MDRQFKGRLEARFGEQLTGPIRQRHDETEMRIAPGDVVVRRTPPCAPCYSRTCARHAGVMGTLTVAEVLAAAERRLAVAREEGARAL